MQLVIPPTDGVLYQWQPGDTLRLELPFELGLQHFPKGGISVDFGPLTMSLPRATKRTFPTPFAS